MHSVDCGQQILLTVICQVTPAALSEEAGPCRAQILVFIVEQLDQSETPQRGQPSGFLHAQCEYIYLSPVRGLAHHVRRHVPDPGEFHLPIEQCVELDGCSQGRPRLLSFVFGRVAADTQVHGWLRLCVC